MTGGREFFRRSPSPERNNMIPPERGGPTFRVTTEPKTPTTRAPTRETPPPVQNQAIKEALEEALRNSGDVFEQPKRAKNRRLRALISRSIVAGVILTAIGVGVNKVLGDDEPTPASREDVNSFRNTFNPADGPRLVETKDEKFDNAAEKGVKGERNTVWMTREKYQQIAPPVIDRENRKEVPLEFNLPPDTVEATGNKTRKVTLEQGTTVTTMIYVKTPEGGIREVSYAKIRNPGEVKGQYPIPIIFPNCKEFLGQKGEIKAGDIFPAPITGKVYNRSTGEYFIEGEYYDDKTGEKFKVVSHILPPFGTITKSLIENVPRLDDFIEGTSWVDAVRKMPAVTVRQGENLLQFITKPPIQQFVMAENIKSQIVVFSSYQGDIGENGIGNVFGGEDCAHPTVDNKAIVLIQ